VGWSQTETHCMEGRDIMTHTRRKVKYDARYCFILTEIECFGHRRGCSAWRSRESGKRRRHKFDARWRSDTQCVEGRDRVTHGEKYKYDARYRFRATTKSECFGLRRGCGVWRSSESERSRGGDTRREEIRCANMYRNDGEIHCM